ncbi:MAG: UTP--glucose-1-phosphate uridylyltransferase [Candidatus Rhabdochlamydia sp.]
MVLIEQLKMRLQQMDQLHLAEKLHLLSEEERSEFFSHLSLDFLNHQRTLSKQTQMSTFEEPATDVDVTDEVWKEEGNQLIGQQKCATLILAGGQGSRLGSPLPKALVPLTLDGKTLLQIHLEKLLSYSVQFQVMIPCIITTSKAHFPLINTYLETHNFFGLSSKSIRILIQEEAPLLSHEGNWFLRDNGTLASAPNGNGSSLTLLAKHNIFSWLNSLGITTMTIIPIDNPLADPLDPILVGYHDNRCSDITLKVIRRERPDEKMGILVVKDHKIQVQEYSELPLEAADHTYFAHIGLFALSLSFAQYVASYTLPWHFCLKKDPITQTLVGKFEQFLFDILSLSQKTHLLLYPREHVYAPLKNATGEHGIEHVREKLGALTTQ